MWFAIHSCFVSCAASAEADGCPDCDFRAEVVDLARWRRRRFSGHPSVMD